jgi:hypothetical protein
VTNFSLYLFHTSLQQFKLNIANMIVSQENASFSTMNADQLFDLFQLTDVDSTKKKEEDCDQRSRKFGRAMGCASISRRI